MQQMNQDDAKTVEEGKEAWRKIDAFEKRSSEFWFAVGKGLLVGRKYYKSNNEFGEWLKEEFPGLAGPKRRDCRAAAIWMAQNYDEVSKFCEENQHLSNPEKVQKAYNESINASSSLGVSQTRNNAVIGSSDNGTPTQRPDSTPSVPNAARAPSYSTKQPIDDDDDVDISGFRRELDTALSGLEEEYEKSMARADERTRLWKETREKTNLDLFRIEESEEDSPDAWISVVTTDRFGKIIAAFSPTDDVFTNLNSVRTFARSACNEFSVKNVKASAAEGNYVDGKWYHHRAVEMTIREAESARKRLLAEVNRAFDDGIAEYRKGMSVVDAVAGNADLEEKLRQAVLSDDAAASMSTIKQVLRTAYKR